MKKPTYEFVTRHATEANNNWSCANLLYFHAFNPNGLVSRKRNNDQRIADLIDSGVVPSGWHLAYGTFADTWATNLSDLAMKRRKEVSRTRVAIELLRDFCEKQEAKIAEAEKKAG